MHRFGWVEYYSCLWEWTIWGFSDYFAMKNHRIYSISLFLKEPAVVVLWGFTLGSGAPTFGDNYDPWEWLIFGGLGECWGFRLRPSWDWYRWVTFTFDSWRPKHKDFEHFAASTHTFFCFDQQSFPWCFLSYQYSWLVAYFCRVWGRQHWQSYPEFPKIRPDIF